jgi:hypothetical protein
MKPNINFLIDFSELKQFILNTVMSIEKSNYNNNDKGAYLRYEDLKGADLDKSNVNDTGADLQKMLAAWDVADAKGDEAGKEAIYGGDGKDSTVDLSRYINAEELSLSQALDKGGLFGEEKKSALTAALTTKRDRERFADNPDAKKHGNMLDKITRMNASAGNMATCKKCSKKVVMGTKCCTGAYCFD